MNAAKTEPVCLEFAPAVNDGDGTVSEALAAGVLVDSAGAEGNPLTLPPAGEVAEADATAEPEETPVAGAEPEETPDAGAEPEETPGAGAEPEETPGADADAVSLATAEVVVACVAGLEVETGAETDED